MGALRSQRAVTVWLLLVCVLVVVMVSVGGYVRLARAGLSIVTWDLVSGVLPPLGEEAWQETFAQYQQTPEFQQVNADITLDEYRRIFYIEYYHRLIARLAGLVVILPLAFFLITGLIPWRRSISYLLVALLFVLQGVLGWYMVSSGLVDRPSVSHYRLALHLLTALLVLGLAFWIALDRRYGTPSSGLRHGRRVVWAIVLLGVLVIQIAYGGFVAGLKAGYVSDTFPLMFGYIVPPGLFTVLQPAWVNLVANTATVQFVHRWLAFGVLGVAAVLAALVCRGGLTREVRRGVLVVVALLGVQIGLGVSVIWLHVPLVLALLHQLTAVFLFLAVLFVVHRLRAA